MDDEMDALISRQTCDLVPTSFGLHVVSCRLVFTIKHHPNNAVNKYKARLVARGLTQTCDVDYLETSSLVACLNSIRVLFSLAVNYQWSMFQLDVKIVFLYSDLRRKSI